MTKENEQFQKFDQAMTTLLKVPRSEVKAQLDAEKAEKKGKKRKPKASASDHASRAKD